MPTWDMGDLQIVIKSNLEILLVNLYIQPPSPEREIPCPILKPQQQQYVQVATLV